MSLVSNQIKVTVAVFVLFIHLKLQEKMKPYKRQIYNTVEYREAVSSMLSLYGGMLFIREDVASGTKMVVVIFLLFINIYFFALWAYLFLTALETTKFKFLSKLKVVLVPFICMRRNTVDSLNIDPQLTEPNSVSTDQAVEVKKPGSAKLQGVAPGKNITDVASEEEKEDPGFHDKNIGSLIGEKSYYKSNDMSSTRNGLLN